MLVRNMLFNLVGLLAPILLALLCIPPLIAGLGTARFGMLTLVWVVLGYFSIFDLGIGRALTLAVSARQAKGQVESINPLIVTGLYVTAMLGLAGAVLLAILSPALARMMATNDHALAAELLPALLAVAVSLPFVTTTAALRGVLEAHGRFDLTSAIRLGMGVITYGGPLLVLQVRHGLVPVVVFLVVARAITWAVHAVAVWRVMPPNATSPRRYAAAELRPLLVSGGWMTVSNVVSPMLSYLDRFVLAWLVGAAMVAHYTTPYEAIIRITLVPEAVLGVMFPALAAALATDLPRARRLYAQCLRVMVAAMLPLAAVVLAFALLLLSAWISTQFAQQSYRVLQVLTLGVAINCVARVPFTAIQSAGRADLTAKLHLVELPFFVLLLFALTHRFGIVGTAWAWTLRATVDFAAIAWMQHRLVPLPAQMRWGWLLLGGVLALLAGVLAETSLSPLISTISRLGLVLAVLAVAWLGVLTAADRALLGDALSRLRQRTQPAKTTQEV